MLKLNISKNTYLAIFFLIFPIVLIAQTKIVNYSIPEWNTNGSFTFSIGSAMNAESGQNEGKITVLDSDGKIILDITPTVIKEIRNQFIKSNLSSKMQNNEKYEQKEYDAALTVLNELYEKLRNMKEVTKLKSIVDNSSSKIMSTLNWSYVLSTIRNQQIEVTGTIE